MEKMIVKRKRRRLKRRTSIIIGIILLLFCLFWLAVNRSMRPAMTALAEARIRSMAIAAMNQAILDNMNDEEIYAALIETYETGERVYMLQTNARNMNLLAADCCAAAQERISLLGEQGISVPIGTISGISLFSGRGPGIHISFTPVGSVSSNFKSDLVSSGINQSLYRVNLILTASVKLIMPGISETIQVSAEAAITESIIVGDVPQVYTNVADEEDMLNFVPTETP